MLIKTEQQVILFIGGKIRLVNNNIAKIKPNKTKVGSLLCAVIL